MRRIAWQVPAPKVSSMMPAESRQGTRGGLLSAFWLFVLIALAFAVGESLEISLRSSDYPQSGSFLQVLIEILPTWLIRAALAPLVGVLVQRFPLTQLRVRNIAVHVLAGVAFAVVHLTLFSAWEHLRWENPWPYFVRLQRLLLQFSAANIVVYWAIAGAYHAYNYYSAYRTRDRAALELKATLSEAKLQALRGQLQPHFLFNTLNTISMLIRQGMNEQAIETVSELSELLRRLIRETPTHEITLASELDFVKRYAAIEQLRFGDRLTIEFDIPERLAQARVPALVLQPLVENAVRHGAAADRPSRITVRALSEGESLRLEVEDNGRGLQPDFALEGAAGVGLRNTVERLAQLYDDNFTFAFRQPENGGLVVALTTPLRFAP